MSIQSQIESLRQQFWAGDASARNELQAILQSDLPVIVRRATSSRGSQSPIGRLVQRLMRDVQSMEDFDGQRRSLDLGLLAAKLCDILLNRPLNPARDT